jgi:hypothetical protein
MANPKPMTPEEMARFKKRVLAAWHHPGRLPRVLSKKMTDEDRHTVAEFTLGLQKADNEALEKFVDGFIESRESNRE